MSALQEAHTPEPSEVTEPVAGSGSLKARLAAAREEMQRERTFKLPAPGAYGRYLEVEYRMLGYEAMRKIGKRLEHLPDTAEREVVEAADTLINACIDLHEKNADGDLISLGKKWSTATIRDLFEVDLPEGATARQALQAAVPSTQLMLHFKDYSEQLDNLTLGLDEALVGESEPARAGSLS